MSLDLKNYDPAMMNSIGTGFQSGSGAPAYTAPQGSLHIRTDGSSTSTRIYINLGGTSAWTSITTGA